MRTLLPRIMWLFIALTVPCSAQQGSAPRSESNWKQICAQATAAPLTVQPPASSQDGDALAKCDETALYYGIGAPPDYAAALTCGWYQRAHPSAHPGNMFYGPGVLSMLYANGKSVPRDSSLAIRFACEISVASDAEMEYRIGHLEKLRDTPTAEAKFDLCDDITSGLSQGYCANIDARLAQAHRNPEVDTLVKALPGAAQAAFPKLQATETAFERARINGEVDLSGSGSAAFQLAEQDKLRQQFLINLQRLARGDIPKATAAQAATLDDQLNETYHRVVQTPPDKWQYGTVKPQGIRATERAWIALADAWGEFAKLAYPQIALERLRAQLIRLRLHQLRSLLGNG